jgi:ABC-2 type transport system permease protein
MSTRLGPPAVDVQPGSQVEPRGASGPSTWQVARLPLRLVRRGAALLCLAAAVLTLVEVASYRQTYPDEASRQQLAQFSDEVAAVRMLQGAPRAVETVGGFVVWDAGWLLALLVGFWSLLVTTRLLRAEEDKGHADLVLARPVAPLRLLQAQLLVLGLCLLAYGAAVAVTLVLLGTSARGAVLFGAGLAGVGATVAAAAAVAAQLFEVRRKAVSATSALLGLAFVARMLGNSEPEREWLLWATPFGWLDLLEPFAADRLLPLMPLVAAPALLVAAAARELGGRDTGSGRLAGRDRRRPRLRLLGDAVSFGWRTGSGVLAAWMVSVAVFGVVTGTLIGPVVDLIEQDDNYRRTLQEFGVDVANPAEGFLSLMAVSLALLFAIHVAWRIGALRAEEGSGRLEHLLVRPVVRWRWLAASSASALLASSLVVLAAATGIWLGAALTGTEVGLWEAFGPVLATFPVVVVFAGLAVLAFGVAPRLTVALPVVVAVVTYLFDLLASVVDLPQPVLDLSPFRWLPRPPAEPFSATTALLLVLVGLVAAVAGIVAFQRRDVLAD